eukprot:COSAG06_NODE_4276_length_4411_cov_1.926716_4_plen_84_part_00
MANLRQILETTGAKVVLSSDWRHGARHKVEEQLAKEGMEGVMVSWTGSHKERSRKHEIMQWLVDHAADVDAWVALDDSDLLHR